MYNENQNNSIKELFELYINSVKPLIALIESQYEKFPEPILNEIRMAHDHLAHCYINCTTDKLIEDEIKSAYGHYRRMLYDCFKFLNVHSKDYIDKFIHDTRHIDLSKIHNGNFLIDYRRLLQTTINTVREAKALELSDFEASLSKFQQSFNSYSEIEKLIEKNLSFIVTAKRKHKYKEIFKYTSWLIGLIVSGLISSSFSCDFYREYFYKLLKLFLRI